MPETASGIENKPQAFKYGRQAEQTADLWLPAGQSPKGVVVLLHGGFWLVQYGKELMTDLARDVVQRGYAALNLEYRRVGSPTWKDANTTLSDVSAGLALLDSGKLPLDGLPFAVVGHSAGGHLALWSQLRSAEVSPAAAVVSAGGVLDLCYADSEELGGGAGAVPRFLSYRETASLRREVSPIDMLPPCRVNSLRGNEAQRGVAPQARIGLIHGSLDEVVPPEQSIRFLVSSTCAGIPCELHLVKEEGHYEVLNPKSKSWQSTMDFVRVAFAAPKRRTLRGAMAATVREELREETLIRSQLQGEVGYSPPLLPCSFDVLIMPAAWSPSSWRTLPKHQMAEWEDKAVADKVFSKLGKLPPLVQPKECDRLKALLAEAGRGERFIVQGGDCAERFMDCEGERLEQQLKLILQMGMVVEHISAKPTLKICRIAGQYGKPRSKPTEVVEGHGEIMSFKGDNINGFDPKDRKWDPERLLLGYWHSSATLNYLRGYAACGDHQPLQAVQVSELKASEHYNSYVEDARAIGLKPIAAETTEFFTSHEAMQLDLEESLTRPVGSKFYNLSAHLVWIGDRTRQLDCAHIEYFRGIANPIGVKVGPSMKNDELKELVTVLNPNKEEGRLMLITRYGAGKAEAMLPGHIQAVKDSGVPVVWQCDGVHGNGIVASNKYKTRSWDAIVTEIAERSSYNNFPTSAMAVKVDPTSLVIGVGPLLHS
ncbi:aro-8 [Symbiodinium necroappetens]|uniref:Phospho-2-dehydro-3-deoxyheptonate aldolase n=1 Tax=Symbiodinium necroappetens TaxID=1628268 RepID=A0A812XHQ3_9DINO|nr:aro-8 [Symbiodinium necroappetens]